MTEKKHDDETKHDTKVATTDDHREPIDPKTGLRGRPDSPTDRPGQLNRDNVNPNITKPGIVDPNTLGMASQAGAKAEASQAFPFTASINEPQTVSLPVPENVEVPKPVITSIDPDGCAIGDADFDLHVSGENFFGDSVIHFAGHDEPTTLNEDGTLSTGIKPSLWTDPVVVQVMIKNGPEVSEPVDFTFAAAGAQRHGKTHRPTRR